ncbi:DUF6668 family protein [Oerskovia enterophila]|uniref:DUF6668 family protein n=1 Tax=Oerskovia enterophila TaxID=43678 RepID=UPI00339AE94B
MTVNDASNPWVSRPAASSPALAATQAPIATAAPTGPVAPQRGVPAPDTVDQLPVVQYGPGEARPLWWLGAHGGAGESKLAHLVEHSRVADHAWPHLVASPRPAPVVLVARSSYDGLRAAQVAATQWASGLVPFVNVLGLVVVADAPGRLPRPLREFAQIVGGGVPRTWTVPWIESWRLGEEPSLLSVPREVRRLVDDLNAILQPGAGSTTN